MFQPVFAVQNDTGRTLKMIVDDVTYTNSDTGKLYFMRSDGSYYNVSTTFSSGDNSFTADITQALTQSGRTDCQLKVTHSGSVVSTYTFALMVQSDVNGLDQVQQEGYSVQDLMDAAEEIVQSGGLTPDIKDAILDCFKNVAWTNGNGSLYYDALQLAFYPPANLDRIEAVFSQGGAIITNQDSLDDLRQYLVVTAYYSDSTSEVVNNYLLSGELTMGNCTITATYAGKSDTFVVNVTFVDNTIIYQLTAPVTLNGGNDRIQTGVTVFDTDKDCTIRVALTNTNNNPSSEYMAIDDNDVSFNVRQTGANTSDAQYNRVSQGFPNMTNRDTTKEIRVVFTHTAGSGKGKFYRSYTDTSNTLIKDTIEISAAFTAYSAQILFGSVRIAPWGIIGTISVADVRKRVMTADEITAFLEGGA